MFKIRNTHPQAEQLPAVNKRGHRHIRLVEKDTGGQNQKTIAHSLYCPSSGRLHAAATAATGLIMIKTA